jgi:dTDP-4-amino-4,6-dideoxygalactose transaminase
MKVPFFDLTRQYRDLRTDVRLAIDRIMEAQTFILGTPVDEFENALARFLDVHDVAGCASGTDALLLPLKAMQLEPGDEVIVPAFTFFATAGAVWNAGLKPVFSDVDLATFNVTVETLEAVRTARTRAVVPVHLFGQMAPMAEISEWANSLDLIVLEDVAQSFGARQSIGGRDVQAGSVGQAASFSFFPTKNLGGAGDGGAVATTSPAVADYIRVARTHGGRGTYDHQFVGTNSRLDSLQAAILSAKLPYLPTWIESRRQNADLYFEVLSGIEELKVPVVAPSNYHTFNQFTVRSDRRDDLQDFLAKAEVGSKVYYPKALHLQECFRSLGGREGDLPVSEHLSRTVLSLPIFPELTREEVSFAAEQVIDFFQG